MSAAAERSLSAPPTTISAGPAPDRSNAIVVPSAERTVSVIARSYRAHRASAIRTVSASNLRRACIHRP